MSSKEFKLMTFAEKLSLYFIDFSMMPLLVFENYLTNFQCFANQSLGININANGEPSLSDMQRLSYCADLFSISDNLQTCCIQNQAWSLLPDIGRVSCVLPAQIMQGWLPYVRFPEWLGKQAIQKKSLRLIRELKENAGNSFNAGKIAI